MEQKASFTHYIDNALIPIKQVLEGPITEDCPPSYLRGMNHLVVALDQVAASKLDLSKLKGMYQDRELLITNL